MTLLAIESSCDESAVAIIDKKGQILAEKIYSQAEHQTLGGVVPEIAARAHIAILPSLLRNIMVENQLSFDDIDCYAATIGPGLIGGLLVGSMLAKSLAYQHNKKFIAVNHLEGHALSPCIEHDIAMPYLLLLISGGHCQILAVEDIGRYRLYGQTIDDSVGEAFDKAARILGLGYPGGPYIEQLASQGNHANVPLPRPLTQHKNCNFSFSGLKTALLHAYQKNIYNKADIAASFQQAVADVLANRINNAIELYKSDYSNANNMTLCVAGGVAANTLIRQTLQQQASKANMNFVAPNIRYCTDNASMIAYVAYQKMRRGDYTSLDVDASPRMPLYDEAS